MGTGVHLPREAVQPVPSRGELLATFRAFERRAATRGSLQLLACVLLLVPVLTRLEFLLAEPLAVLVLVGAVAVDALGGVTRALFQRALDTDTMAADRRVGRFTGAELKALVATARQAMGPAAARIPVHVVAGKELNAHAYNLGALFSRRLHAVYLNRALLHVLSPRQLLYILGHELAHLCRYRTRTPAGILLMLLVRVLLAVLVMAWAWDLGEGPALMAAVAAVGLHARFSPGVTWELSQVVELLCDDAGAHLCGVDDAIRAEIRSGMLAEQHEEVWATVIRLRAQGLEVSASAALEAYERALPYGAFDRGKVQEDLEKHLRNLHHRAASDLSLRGFMEFAGLAGDSSAQDDALDAMLETHAALARVERVAWPGTLETDLTDVQVAQVVSTLRREPGILAFLSRTELDVGSTHPSFRRRILYLWEHAAEISAGR